MGRPLFCSLGTTAYKISVFKCRVFRRAQDIGKKFAHNKKPPLPNLIYRHKSLIRRALGNVDMQLQENKAVNLSLAAPKISDVVIAPGETFSFWRLAGKATAKKGYKEGLAISRGKAVSGIGGGMCQFTNLLHWLSLHSPLHITEHHHHDGIDLFPDFNRQVPFGVGTSIFYNYLDYRVKNNTENTFQFIVYSDGTYLCGELRSEHPLSESYHIIEQDKHFEKHGEAYFRFGKVYRAVFDKRTGNETCRSLIKENRAKVMYSPEFIDKTLILEESCL